MPSTSRLLSTIAAKSAGPEPLHRKEVLRIMKLLGAAVAVLGLSALGAAAFVWSGVYNIAADEPHFELTTATLQTLRTRSIAVRAKGLEVPDLQEPDRIRRGAGNYDAMCVACHLAPGASPTELSQGLYPAPPNLSKLNDIDAAQAFWVVKHGIKASGMPAWGKNMDDAHVWDLVAFVKQLPRLTPDQYAAAVAASDGHSHGGGEAMGHEHPVGAADAHPGKAASQETQPQGTQGDHRHADGRPHSHSKAPSRSGRSHGH